MAGRVTWRDDVAGPVDGADDGPVRAGWEILDGLRSIVFTGSVDFPLMPAATVYLDRGRIYFAERHGDPDVADRLVAAGAVRPRDLATGVLVVGDDDRSVDHLGRLFSRVPSLDRQRVMLALELLTEETAAWIARQSVRQVVTQPYTYHPSGVHQWYAPAPTPSSPPLSSASFTTFAPPPTTRMPSDRAHTPADLAGVRIEWSEPAATPEPPSAPGTPTPRRWDPADRGAPAAPASPAPDVRPADGGRSGKVDDLGEIDDPATDRFEVVWPSGDVGEPEPDFDPPPHPTIAAGGDGLDRFDAPLDGGDLDYPTFPDDDADSREVAIAVRRAIAAVESRTTRVRPVPTVAAPAPNPTSSAPSGVDADVDGDTVIDTDDDPFTATGTAGGHVVSDDPFDDAFTPRSPSSGHADDDERRNGLHRWFGPKRTR